MSRTEDKLRKEAEWYDDSQTAWNYNGFMVTKVPGLGHLYQVRNEDDTPVEGLSGSYTQRAVAYAAIDQYAAKVAKGKVA